MRHRRRLGGGISYGFSSQNPAEYMEEHEASLIDFEVEGVQDRQALLEGYSLL